jgi:hypothetical protein
MRAKRATDLKHKLLWYVTTYRLPLSTIRRHRKKLDEPMALLFALINSPGRLADVQGLSDYLNAHEAKSRRKLPVDAPPPELLV